MIMKKNSITFVHLWNNYSGSPNVLRTIISELNQSGNITKVVSSFNNNGFLSNVYCDEKINIKYSFKHNKVLRFFQFFRFQILSSLYILKLPKDEIVYINTIQPFLPAIVAHIKKNQVVYHIHEAYPRVSLFKKFLFKVAFYTSDSIICVSNFVKDRIDNKAMSKAMVIYNSLDTSFISGMTEPHKGSKENSRKNILMVSSPKRYKGVFEFCELAVALPKYNFTLVCDADQFEIHQLFKEYTHVENLSVIGSQIKMHNFFSTSDIIVNLSNPEMIFETFGLSVLEGMSYGLPAIVPRIGGVTELILDGENGFQVDVNNFDELKSKISKLLEDKELYDNFSCKAKERAKLFSQKHQSVEINTLIGTLLYKQTKQSKLQ